MFRTLDLLARHVSDVDELWRALDEHAIWAGGHGYPEACALLLDASDSLRAALDRADAHDRKESRCRTDSWNASAPTTPSWPTSMRRSSIAASMRAAIPIRAS